MFPWFSYGFQIIRGYISTINHRHHQKIPRMKPPAPGRCSQPAAAHGKSRWRISFGPWKALELLDEIYWDQGITSSIYRYIMILDDIFIYIYIFIYLYRYLYIDIYLYMHVYVYIYKYIPICRFIVGYSYSQWFHDWQGWWVVTDCDCWNYFRVAMVVLDMFSAKIYYGMKINLNYCNCLQWQSCLPHCMPNTMSEIIISVVGAMCRNQTWIIRWLMLQLLLATQYPAHKRVCTRTT